MRHALYLPQRLKFMCSSCAGSFWVGLRAIDGKAHLTCPHCRSEIEIYGALPPEVRAIIYRKAREKLEENLALLADTEE